MRHLWRSLRQRPGFSLVVVLTLGLGIGSATSILTVVNGLLLRPLPYPDPGRIAAVSEEAAGDPPRRVAVSWMNFRDWQRSAGGFEHLAARAGRTLALTGDGAAERVRASYISAHYFDVLGVAPVLGRVFSEEEDVGSTAPPLAILSHGLWERRYAQDPSILGRSILLNGVSHTVVGVLPRGFVDPFEDHSSRIDVFTPAVRLAEVDHAGLSVIQERRYRRFTVVGRLAPRETMVAAQEELDRLGDRLEEAYPADNGGYGIRARLLTDILSENLRRPVSVLFAAALILMVIAIANVLGLFLVRGSARRNEMAVRLALGGTWRHLAASWLTESLGLAALGGGVGILVSYWELKALLAISPIALPAVFTLVPDGVVLTGMVLLTLVTGLVVGMIPAMKTPESWARHSLGSRATGGRDRSAWGGALICFEVCTAMVLLVGTSLMLRSFQTLRGTGPGYDPDGVLAVRVDLPLDAYPDRASQLRFAERLSEELHALPGVDWSGVWGPGRPGAAAIVQSIVPEGTLIEKAGDAQYARRHFVDPGELAALGIRVVRGRDFAVTDGPDTPPVTIVSEAFAKRVWPGQDPLGKRFHQFIPVGSPSDLYPTFTVIGVASDASHGGRVPDDDVAERGIDFYGVNPQGASSGFNVLLHTNGDPLALVGSARQVLKAMDPNVPLTDIRPLDGFLALEEAPARFAATLMSMFGLFALFLTALGVYGVLAFSVVQRRREIGIRAALGAEAGENVLLFFRHAVGLAVLGAAAGAVAAMMASSLLTSVLFGVPPLDPLSYGTAALVLLVVAGVSAYLPSRRAAAVDPAKLLRDA